MLASQKGLRILPPSLRKARRPFIPLFFHPNREYRQPGFASVSDGGGGTQKAHSSRRNNSGPRARRRSVHATISTRTEKALQCSRGFSVNVNGKHPSQNGTNHPPSTDL